MLFHPLEDFFWGGVCVGGGGSRRRSRFSVAVKLFLEIFLVITHFVLKGFLSGASHFCPL